MTKGWTGDSKRHGKAGKVGGKATVENHGKEHFKKIGVLGGSNSPTNFKHDPERASKLGRIGAKLRWNRVKNNAKEVNETN